VPSSSVIRGPLFRARFGRDLCQITGAGRPVLDCLRAAPINTLLNNPLGGGRRNVIVPFGMPVVSGDGQGGELGVADLDAFGIVGLVPLGEDAQSGGRGGGAYEVDDDLVRGCRVISCSAMQQSDEPGPVPATGASQRPQGISHSRSHCTGGTDASPPAQTSATASKR